VAERFDGGAKVEESGMRLSRIRFPSQFFALFGYVGLSTIIAALLLELGAFLAWSAYHWVRPLQRDFASTSPAYDAYPWASEFWKEEKSRWKSQRVYQPFRVWGGLPWHSRYINTDDTPDGSWRRTINPTSPNCEIQATIDVWMFGGSTVYGTDVPDSATLPSYLSRDLNSAGRGCVVVTNLGVEGYVTNQEVIVLMEQLKAGRHPGVVIFYDGVNDAYAGAISPGVPNAHLALADTKARVEGSLAGRLDFLQNSYALRLARAAVHSLHRPSAADPPLDEIESKAEATLDNYEANLRIARILGEAFGFRVFCFWQPASVYGHKPLDPFEVTVPGNGASKPSFHILSTVYQHAERRAARDHTFVFLGNIFDSVQQPLYLDWMHLAPQGNELVAHSLAKAVQDGLKSPQRMKSAARRK
jgi:lysophospholipase L1-like esterase